MLKKLEILHGSPAAGKSTWVVAQTDALVVCPDEIRIEIAGLDNGKISQKAEMAVWKQVRENIISAMKQGVPRIILDATCPNTRSIALWMDVAGRFGYKIVMVDFSDVDKQVCLERNKTRGFREVPAFVIENWFSRVFQGGKNVVKIWCEKQGIAVFTPPPDKLSLTFFSARSPLL